MEATTTTKKTTWYRRLVTALEQDLPLVSRPFQVIAERAGLDEQTLLSLLREGVEDKTLRRYGARIKHQSVGYTANAMVVWKVPEERIREVGSILAQHRAVTHAYQRPTFEDFPYNVYCMVHAHSRDECQKAIEDLHQATGIDEYLPLYSTREFKKSAPIYSELAAPEEPER